VYTQALISQKLKKLIMTFFSVFAVIFIQQLFGNYKSAQCEEMNAWSVWQRRLPVYVECFGGTAFVGTGRGRVQHIPPSNRFSFSSTMQANAMESR
jgi:hypothetical protein